MLGIVVLGFVIVYLAVAVGATAFIVFVAKKTGDSVRMRWIKGLVVALLFYLIPFWDWIPTVMAHQYYCSKEAKFEVITPLDQWKAANSEILSTLHYDPKATSIRLDGRERFPLNQRLAVDRIFDEPVFLSVSRRRGWIVDTRDGLELAIWVDFRAGPKGAGGFWKAWLSRAACSESDGGYWSKFTLLEQQAVKLGEK